MFPFNLLTDFLWLSGKQLDSFPAKSTRRNKCLNKPACELTSAMVIEGIKVTPESAAQISAVTKLSSASNPHRISHFDASRRDGTGSIERQRLHSHSTGPKVPIINCCCLYSRRKFQKFCREHDETTSQQNKMDRFVR